MPNKTVTQQTVKSLFNTGGISTSVPDTGVGSLWRPTLVGTKGGRSATAETLFDFWLDWVPDPDEALVLDPNFFTKLRFHADVSAAFQKRQLTVAGYPERIEPNPLADNADVAKEVTKEVSRIYFGLPNRKKLYAHLQRAVLEGGACVEFTWQKDSAGFEYPTGHNIVSKTRIVMDRMGNLSLLTRANPVWGALAMPNPNDFVKNMMAENELLPLSPLYGKFIYHTYLQYPGMWNYPQLEGYTYYGIGLDVPLYYTISWDIFVLQNRIRHIAKYGDPPYNLYGSDASDPNALQVAKSIALTRGEAVRWIPGKMQGQTPENGQWYLEQQEVPDTNDIFAQFSDDYTRARVNALILGSADENSKGKSGGYSDHVSRKDSGPQVLFKYDAENISETITTQLISAIAKARFPNLHPTYWPVFTLEPAEERDRQQEVDILEKALSLGLKVSKTEAYEKIGLRVPEPDEELLEAPPILNPNNPLDPNQKPIGEDGDGEAKVSEGIDND